ncbi:MAG: hypothetical protein VYE68_05815 [Acidobacteriota bacterium]|nr:hypothetical protein [Acidobacteriota bacterium]
MPSRLAEVGFVAMLTVVTGAVVGTQSNLASEAAGARLEKKLRAIVEQAAHLGPDATLTTLSQHEINAYLTYQGQSQLPTGITEPFIRITGEERVSAEAVVDLNTVRDRRPRGWLDPFRYLVGQLEVTAAGTVHASERVARVSVETVTVAGIPVPIQVLQEVVQYYTRTAAAPNGTRLDEPIPLPYDISEIRLSSGVAVIVQTTR